MEPFSLFPYMDRDVIKILEPYGGWQRVLDPLFDVPEDLYRSFEAVGYSRGRLDKLRAVDGQPERDAWLNTISRGLYLHWRMNYLRSLHLKQQAGLLWKDYPYPSWDAYEEPMKRLSIAKEDIYLWLDGRSDKFPKFLEDE